MSDFTITGITTKQLEAAKDALSQLYVLKDEYAKAQNNLMRIEMKMAQYYDTVNYVFRHIKAEVQEGKARTQEGGAE